MSLGRKCIYDDKAIKYLVQVRDDVEAGDEKMKELEQEMKDWGIYDTDFSLGDVMDDDDTESSAGDAKPKKRWWIFLLLRGKSPLPNTSGLTKNHVLRKKLS